MHLAPSLEYPVPARVPSTLVEHGHEQGWLLGHRGLFSTSSERGGCSQLALIWLNQAP